MPKMTLERAVQISRIILSNDVTHNVDASEKHQAYRVLADLKLPAEGDHKGLPVAGYAKTQSTENVNLVNEGKLLEERVLRYIDKLDQAGGNGATFDGRWLATGRTDIQKGFMSVFRSVFQPQRIELPGDHDEPYVLRAGEGR